MKCGARTIVALAMASGCIRERAPRVRDAGVTEALRPSPGRQVLPASDKPDVPVPVIVAVPTPEALSIEARLRRCDASVQGAVVRVSDDVAYAAETGPTGPVIRLVRRAGGEFVCERYEVPAGAPRLAWPGAPTAGEVALARATGGDVGAGSALLVELGGDQGVRAATVIQGSCGPGSTVQAVRLFEGAPAVQVRCWIATEGSWMAADHLFHKGSRGWQALAYAECGRIVRPPTITIPPANAVLRGSIRVLEAGASPRLEVASSSVDGSNGSAKFSRLQMRWNDAERRFEPTGTPVIERR